MIRSNLKKKGIIWIWSYLTCFVWSLFNTNCILKLFWCNELMYYVQGKNHFFCDQHYYWIFCGAYINCLYQLCQYKCLNTGRRGIDVFFFFFSPSSLLLFCMHSFFSLWDTATHCRLQAFGHLISQHVYFLIHLLYSLQSGIDTHQ